MYRVMVSRRGRFWSRWWTYSTLAKAKKAELYLRTVRNYYVRIVEETEGMYD